MNDWTHARSERLALDRPVPTDADDLFAIHHDPRSWSHFPQGRHLEPARTQQMVEDALLQWATDGLGSWTARRDGRVVGWAGCAVPRGLPWWNLAYRFDAATHGTGLGAEAGVVAIAAANDVDADRPVLAYLLEHNVASRRTAERLGLRLLWRGPDAGNDAPDAVRLVYLDRDPTGDLLAVLADHGMGPAGLLR